VKAIDTHYQGHRFRSRLEARWAVVFDELGLQWQYEPQGYELEHRITREPGTFNYLPDFFLPEVSVWVEVKGELDLGGYRRLLDAAAALSAPGGGCGRTDVVVLGPISNYAVWPPRLPVRLHMHKGDLAASPWLPRSDYYDRHGLTTVRLANDMGDVLSPLTGIEVLLRGIQAPTTSTFDAAVVRGREARFEHGEMPRKPISAAGSFVSFTCAICFQPLGNRATREVHSGSNIYVIHEECAS